MQEQIREDNEILRFGAIRDRLEDAGPHEDIPNEESSRACPHCGAQEEVFTVRQRTQYAEEKLNWFTGCEACIKHNEGYWDDMWYDFYQGVL